MAKFADIEAEARGLTQKAQTSMPQKAAAEPEAPAHLGDSGALLDGSSELADWVASVVKDPVGTARALANSKAFHQLPKALAGLSVLQGGNYGQALKEHQADYDAAASEHPGADLLGPFMPLPGSLPGLGAATEGPRAVSLAQAAANAGKRVLVGGGLGALDAEGRGQDVGIPAVVGGALHMGGGVISDLANSPAAREFLRHQAAFQALKAAGAKMSLLKGPLGEESGAVEQGIRGLNMGLVPPWANADTISHLARSAKASSGADMERVQDLVDAAPKQAVVNQLPAPKEAPGPTPPLIAKGPTYDPVSGAALPHPVSVQLPEPGPLAPPAKGPIEIQQPVDWNAIMGDIHKNITGPQMTAGGEGTPLRDEALAVERSLVPSGEPGRKSMSDSRVIKTAHGETTDFNKLPGRQNMDAQAYGTINKHMDDTVERSVGPDALADYQDARAKNQTARVFDILSNNKYRTEMGNKMLSPSDKAVGIAGGLQKTISNGDSLPAATLQGAAMAIANKQLRERGNSYAANALNHLASAPSPEDTGLSAVRKTQLLNWLLGQKDKQDGK